MSHLKKGDDGHLLKNAAGHLVKDCEPPVPKCGECCDETYALTWACNNTLFRLGTGGENLTPSTPSSGFECRWDGDDLIDIIEFDDDGCVLEIIHGDALAGNDGLTWLVDTGTEQHDTSDACGHSWTGTWRRAEGPPPAEATVTFTLVAVGGP